MIIELDSGSSELHAFLEKPENTPRHIWINGAKTIVFTGDDMPSESQAQAE